MPREVWDDATVICRCEEITTAEVRLAVSEGASTFNDVKRRTRAGMGACQGIYCLRSIAGLLQLEAGIDPASLQPMTTRPPARMIPLHALAVVEETSSEVDVSVH